MKSTTPFIVIILLSVVIIIESILVLNKYVNQPDTSNTGAFPSNSHVVIYEDGSYKGCIFNHPCDYAE